MVVERASETRQRGQLPPSAPGGIGWPQRRQVFAPVIIKGDGWLGSKYYRLKTAEMLRPRPGLRGRRRQRGVTVTALYPGQRSRCWRQLNAAKRWRNSSSISSGRWTILANSALTDSP